MTQEEISRFASQLSEAERIRVLMAQDATSTDGIPSATELLVEGPGGGFTRDSAAEPGER